VRVAVITGGHRCSARPVFSAAADLKEIQRLLSSGQLGPHRLVEVLLLERATPWIAAVDGLAPACDLVVASTRAGFGVPR
jgi:enoyl-CoA hydratase/carnithine racemase